MNYTASHIIRSWYTVFNTMSFLVWKKILFDSFYLCASEGFCIIAFSPSITCLFSWCESIPKKNVTWCSMLNNSFNINGTKIFCYDILVTYIYFKRFWIYSNLYQNQLQSDKIGKYLTICFNVQLDLFNNYGPYNCRHDLIWMHLYGWIRIH